jgi:hypothetical protein
MCAAPGAFVRRRRGAPDEVMRLARAAEFQGEWTRAMTEPEAWQRYSVWLWPARVAVGRDCEAQSTVRIASVLMLSPSVG